MKRILMLTPVNPDINQTIWSRHLKARWTLMDYKDSRFELFSKIDKSKIPDLPNNIPRISKCVRARNKMIEEINLDEWDYIFWLDADLVDFAPDTLSRLFDALFYKQPDCIVASMPLIEETEKFYDWGAFIQRGTSHIAPESFQQIWGRNVNSWPPYWHPGYPLTNLMEMDSVAQCVLIPAFLYKSVQHSCPNAFYEFWPVCEHARTLGIKTFVDTRVIVQHANFTLYNQIFNEVPMDLEKGTK